MKAVSVNADGDHSALGAGVGGDKDRSLDGASGDILLSSVALACVSVLAVTISAVVGVALLSPRTWQGRTDAVAPTTEYVHKDGDGREDYSNLSLGTQDCIAV